MTQNILTFFYTFSVFLFTGTDATGRCLTVERDRLALPALPGGESRYRCGVMADQEGRFTGLSQEIFPVNDPPYNGHCQVSPKQGTNKV